MGSAMPGAGWLTRSRTDVPPGDFWLGERERAVLAGLRMPRRRDDWRLGRWTAKAALRAWSGSEPEVLAAPDGAPQAAGLPGVHLSLSHRAGRGLAVVGDEPVGCDLEWVEPRSSAFAREWLTAGERAWVAEGDAPERANLVWCAKEAAAKVRRAGLRLDVRRTEVRPAGAGFAVHDPAAGTLHGWWWRDGPYVVAVAAAQRPLPELRPLL